MSELAEKSDHVLKTKKAGQDSSCSIRKGKQSACSFSNSDPKPVSDGGRAVLHPPPFPQGRHRDFHQHSTSVHPALIDPHPQSACKLCGHKHYLIAEAQALNPRCSERSQKGKDAVGFFLALITSTCSMTKL